MAGEMVGREAESAVVQTFLERPTEGLRALVLEGDAQILGCPVPADRRRSNLRT